MAEDSGISWHVETHAHADRSVDWYWAFGLIGLAAFVLSLIFGNVMLALIIALSGGSLAALMLRGPREHQVRVDSRGVSLDGTLYRYSSIDSFWVDEHHEPQLLISTHGILHPQLIVPVVDRARAQNLRNYLRRHCREEEQEPHIGEHVAEMLGL